MKLLIIGQASTDTEYRTHKILNTPKMCVFILSWVPAGEPSSRHITSASVTRCNIIFLMTERRRHSLERYHPPRRPGADEQHSESVDVERDLNSGFDHLKIYYEERPF